jgi:hypothetical protein
MSRRANYVIFNHNGATGVLMSMDQEETHRELIETSNVKQADVISAGICSAAGRGLLCYGRAEDLNIGSTPSDSEVIRKIISGNEA